LFNDAERVLSAIAKFIVYLLEKGEGRGKESGERKGEYNGAGNGNSRKIAHNATYLAVGHTH